MIESLCSKTYKNFISENKQDKERACSYMLDISKYSYNNLLSFNELKHILDLEEKLLPTSGKYKTMIEKEIFYILRKLTDNCMEINNHEIIYFDRTNKKEIMEDEKISIIYLIIKFSIEAFNHKKERDSFSTKRKIIITELLTSISYYYKLESAYKLSLTCLKSKKQGIATAGNNLKTAYLSNNEFPER